MVPLSPLGSGNSGTPCARMHLGISALAQGRRRRRRPAAPQGILRGPVLPARPCCSWGSRRGAAGPLRSRRDGDVDDFIRVDGRVGWPGIAVTAHAGGPLVQQRVALPDPGWLVRNFRRRCWRCSPGSRCRCLPRLATCVGGWTHGRIRPARYRPPRPGPEPARGRPGPAIARGPRPPAAAAIVVHLVFLPVISSTMQIQRPQPGCTGTSPMARPSGLLAQQTPLPQAEGFTPSGRVAPQQGQPRARGSVTRRNPAGIGTASLARFWGFGGSQLMSAVSRKPCLPKKSGRGLARGKGAGRPTDEHPQRQVRTRADPDGLGDQAARAAGQLEWPRPRSRAAAHPRPGLRTRPRRARPWPQSKAASSPKLGARQSGREQQRKDSAQPLAAALTGFPQASPCGRPKSVRRAHIRAW